MNALHGTQVYLIHGCGVFGGAVQYRYLGTRCARLLQHVDCSLNFAQRRHASGKDDSLAELADMAQVRQVGDLAGRNLEVILPKTQQQIDALDIETGREKADVARGTMRHKLLVHRLSKLQTTKHFMLRFTAIRSLGLIVRLLGGARDLAVGVKGLKLDEIHTGLSSHIDQLLGKVEVAIMVNAGFGDDECSVFHELTLPTKRA